MSAKRLLEDGKLAEAVEAQLAEVKARPSDLSARTFLFELLAYRAEWDRAGRQLDAIGHLLNDDPAAQVGASVLRRLVEAEQTRARVLTGQTRPKFLLHPPEDVEAHVEALGLIARGEHDEARIALDRAFAQRAPRPGSLAEGRFDDFRDADDLLAPVLEVFGPAGYAWVPFEHIQFLNVSPPKSLRDLLWAPAQIASFDGQLGEVHLPALYPGSHSHEDRAARLGRSTVWDERPGGIVRGAGLKTFLVGDDARTLFELADLRFDAPAESR